MTENPPRQTQTQTNVATLDHAYPRSKPRYAALDTSQAFRQSSPCTSVSTGEQSSYSPSPTAYIDAELRVPPLGPPRGLPRRSIQNVEDQTYRCVYPRAVALYIRLAYVGATDRRVICYFVMSLDCTHVPCVSNTLDITHTMTMNLQLLANPRNLPSIMFRGEQHQVARRVRH